MWRNRRMGGEMTKITFVGAVLVIAVVLIVLAAFRVLAEQNRSDLKESGQ